MYLFYRQSSLILKNYIKLYIHTYIHFDVHILTCLSNHYYIESVKNININIIIIKYLFLCHLILMFKPMKSSKIF